MERVAKCQCGGFSVTVRGDPTIVNICHCTECQRRTGSPLSSTLTSTGLRCVSQATDEELLAMLKPSPDQVLKVWPVDKKVGNVLRGDNQDERAASVRMRMRWGRAGRRRA